ncbi:MAG: GDYXXLXY domain-containing protein [Candidatus Omnitrophica bacterium]|nr:GDYXXLXY domain-containing protein [Candidatus Omnitrophota bacterium]
MKKNEYSIYVFLAAILVQVAVLALFAYHKELSIRSGTKIIVEAIPQDPRSIFRGDYIRLSYEFSQINLNEVLHNKDNFYRGQEVFVKLSSIGDNWKPAQISDSLLTSDKEDELIISGVVEEAYPGKSVNVIYGIESYFVPEGKGRYLEKQILQHNVQVKLSIDKRGEASVCKIFIDGHEVNFR